MNKYEELKSHHKFMLQQARDEGYDLECAFQSGVLNTLDTLEKDIKKAQALDIIMKYFGLSLDRKAYDINKAWLSVSNQSVVELKKEDIDLLDDVLDIYMMEESK